MVWWCDGVCIIKLLLVSDCWQWSGAFCSLSPSLNSTPRTQLVSGVSAEQRGRQWVRPGHIYNRTGVRKLYSIKQTQLILKLEFLEIVKFYIKGKTVLVVVTTLSVFDLRQQLWIDKIILTQLIKQKPSSGPYTRSLKYKNMKRVTRFWLFDQG